MEVGCRPIGGRKKNTAGVGIGNTGSMREVPEADGNTLVSGRSPAPGKKPTEKSRKKCYKIDKK